MTRAAPDSRDHPYLHGGSQLTVDPARAHITRLLEPTEIQLIDVRSQEHAANKPGT